MVLFLLLDCLLMSTLCRNFSPIHITIIAWYHWKWRRRWRAHEQGEGSEERGCETFLFFQKTWNFQFIIIQQRAFRGKHFFGSTKPRSIAMKNKKLYILWTSKMRTTFGLHNNINQTEQEERKSEIRIISFLHLRPPFASTSTELASSPLSIIRRKKVVDVEFGKVSRYLVGLKQRGTRQKKAA